MPHGRSVRVRGMLRLLQVAVMLAASGCAVSSDHPLLRLDESEPVPEYLLGAWDFVEIVGLNAEDRPYGMTLDRNVDGSLKILLTEPAGTVETHASLATVGGLKILSIAPREGDETWGFGTIGFDEATQTLTLTFLGHAEVARDIRLGLVAGEIYQFDQEELARLNASPEQLRTYFAAHGEAFNDPVIVLKKRPS